MAADMVEGATRHSAEVEVMAVDMVEGITAGMAEDIVADHIKEGMDRYPPGRHARAYMPPGAKEAHHSCR